jgi:glycolate oxidase FAD binding subunit
LRIETPESAAEAAAVLAAGGSVRPRGGGTKWDWGANVPEPDVALSTAGLDRIVEHNAGDLTAVLGSGVRLADAQAEFARAGQMLALDPPDGGAATIGGVVATADSGPLRHRYGAARDLLLGMTVALSDGSVARSGGKVIKNVAGYDLGKLFAGSFGTLGTIVEVVVRLHPRPVSPVTVVARGGAEALAGAAARLSAAPLELEALDVAWSAGEGMLLARVCGVASAARAERIAGLATGLDVSVREDAKELWSAQREGQRGDIVLRVSALPASLDRVLAAAGLHGASLVGRAGIGVHWLQVSAESLPALRRELAQFPCVLLDAPPELRDEPWGVEDEALLALSRRVKERFDPAGTCSPGVFVGGI